MRWPTSWIGDGVGCLFVFDEGKSAGMVSLLATHEVFEACLGLRKQGSGPALS